MPPKGTLLSAKRQSISVKSCCFTQSAKSASSSSARALRGPRAPLYQGEAFDAFRYALFEHEPERPERLEHPVFAAADPEEMLIDEVEAIWAAIDQGDDWSPFHAKIDRLRAARAARQG